jgi:hypothetical protein
MAPVIVTFEELDDDAKMEVMSNPNIQSRCLQFVGRVRRVQGDDYETEEEAEAAANIAAELMEYLPFNALNVTEDDGTVRLTQSPSEISFILAYYMAEAGLIPK